MIQILATIIFVIFWDMNKMWHPYLRFKPFNCVPCLSVWVCLILSFIPKEISEYISIFFGAGIIAPIINHYINKL